MRSFLTTLFLVCFLDILRRTLGDIGTAKSYDPPYLPTRCSGYNQDLPPSGLFVAASDGIWDNGAACGRRYMVRCISGPRRPCKTGSIVVQVVDFCHDNPCPATMALSQEAFNAVSRHPNAKINIEYAQI